MKLVVLGRDGVINELGDGEITSAADWHPIEGSAEAIARLCQANYQVVVIANLPAIGRGLLSLEELHEIHEKMNQTIAAAGGHLDGVFFCPHIPDDDCNCRKPRAGLLDSIMERLNIELTGVPLVGDSLRDVQAAMVVGATPVLVRTGEGATTLEQNKRLDNVALFDDLAGFVDDLLQAG